MLDNCYIDELCKTTIRCSVLCKSELLNEHNFKKKFEDTKEVIRSCKSKKDIQYSGRNNINNRTNIDLKQIQIKLKNEPNEPHKKTGGDLRYSGEISNSCFTSSTHHDAAERYKLYLLWTSRLTSVYTYKYK